MDNKTFEQIQEQMINDSIQRAEKINTHNLLRACVLDEIVFDTVFSLVKHGVDNRELEDIVIPKLRSAHRASYEYKIRYDENQDEARVLMEQSQAGKEPVTV